MWRRDGMWRSLELEGDAFRRARCNVIGTVSERCCGLEGGDCVRHGGDDDGDRGGAGLVIVILPVMLFMVFVMWGMWPLSIARVEVTTATAMAAAAPVVDLAEADEVVVAAVGAV